MRALDREIVSQVNKHTRRVLTPLWRAEVAARARTPLDLAVIAKGTRVKAGNPPTALAAQSRRELTGGLMPASEWFAVELGSNRQNATTTYTRRKRNGGSTSVTRHTSRQLPRRTKRGRVALPAMAEIAPRMASLWAATIVRTVYDSLPEA